MRAFAPPRRSGVVSPVSASLASSCTSCVSIFCTWSRRGISLCWWNCSRGTRCPRGAARSHATASVKERFGQASALFAVDQLIKGVLKALTGLVRGVFRLLPIPGAQQFLRVVQMFLRIAVGFIDEVILAYSFRTRAENPWAASRDGLVLYGQNLKPMFKNAAWLALTVYGLSFVIFLLMLAPAAVGAYWIPGGWSATGVIVALLFAWSVKVAVLEPFAITCMMQAYFKTIEGQTPDPEWEAKLNGLSKKFRQLKGKAGESMPSDSMVPVSGNLAQ